MRARARSTLSWSWMRSDVALTGEIADNLLEMPRSLRVNLRRADRRRITVPWKPLQPKRLRSSAPDASAARLCESRSQPCHLRGSAMTEWQKQRSERNVRLGAADLLIANVIGGYGLPDGVFARVIHAEQALLKEMLESISAETLTKARERARAAAGLGSC